MRLRGRGRPRRVRECVWVCLRIWLAVYLRIGLAACLRILVCLRIRLADLPINLIGHCHSL